MSSPGTYVYLHPPRVWNVSPFPPPPSQLTNLIQFYAFLAAVLKCRHQQSRETDSWEKRLGQKWFSLSNNNVSLTLPRCSFSWLFTCGCSDQIAVPAFPEEHAFTSGFHMRPTGRTLPANTPRNTGVKRQPTCFVQAHLRLVCGHLCNPTER